MGQKIISAIDIRADKIICLIAQELQILDRGKILQLIGIGISKLSVDCLKPLSLEKEEIKNNLDIAISKAEIEAGINISNVYVSISENMKSDYIEFENNILGETITENDVKSFLNSATFKNLYTDTEEPLHSFPISFKVDKKKSVSDPIGITADTLLTRWHVISTSKNYLNKILDLFNNQGIILKQVVSSHYASSLAVLSDEEADNGAVSIDIQKNKTIISYTFDNQLIGYDIIKVGTYNFSNDISQVKSISLEEAELVRKQIDTMNSQRIYEKKLEKYYEIYSSRAEELSTIIRNTILKSKYSPLVSNNIVLTGYGAKSLTVQKLIKQYMSSSNFRLGSTKKINGSKTYLDNPSLASAFGLLTYATNHSMEGDKDEPKLAKNSILSVIYNFFKNL
tara:strand:- start:2607 stop:3794 length:1188 start_codon:yes stop_codon:yes gene_type:complete